MPKPKRTPWETLASTYSRKGVVLVLGAGVSLASGVPAWDPLLDELAENRRATKMVQTLRERGFSLAVIASALEDLYGGRAEFLTHLRGTLYARTPLTRPTRRHPVSIDLLQQVKRSNPTLRSIAALCVHSERSAFIPNSKVRCVVSFNLDTLLEAFTRKYATEFLSFGRFITLLSRPRRL